MATIADVAKRAGVALSTVSYALNGTRPISEETKQRIYKAIEELNYHPNVLARGLVTKRTRIIALMYPPLTKGLRSQTQLEFMFGASQAASQRGYALVLQTSPDDEQEILRLTREGYVGGVVLMRVQQDDPRIDLLKDLNFPFSMIGRSQNNEGVSYVDFDFEQALQLCVNHLKALGHKHIALLNYPHIADGHIYNAAVLSLTGFQAAVESRELSGVIYPCEPLPEKSYEVIRTVLEEHPALTAMIIMGSRAYLGGVKVFNEKGFRIPENFSVSGVTSSQMAELTPPPLTGTDLPAAEMGRIGTELLIDQIEGRETQPKQILLPATLTIRQSTGPCPSVLSR